MSDPDLHEAIGHLSEALDGASLDPEREARIREALAELREVAEGPDEPGPHHRDNLIELVEHVAEEHPVLATSLGRLADILSKLGI